MRTDRELVSAATHVVVVDLEATCSENNTAFPADEMETIEIGAVLMRLADLVAEGEFQSFVRPVRHPKLTAFCTKLTGITQTMVEDAPTFPEAFGALRSALVAGRSGLVWGSWGRYDYGQLQRDCQRNRIPFHMPPHVNLKVMFSDAQTVKKQGMAQALALCDLALEGSHHPGIDDARNIARLLPWILGQRRVGGL